MPAGAGEVCYRFLFRGKPASQSLRGGTKSRRGNLEVFTRPSDPELSMESLLDPYQRLKNPRFVAEGVHAINPVFFYFQNFHDVKLWRGAAFYLGKLCAWAGAEVCLVLLDDSAFKLCGQ